MSCQPVRSLVVCGQRVADFVFRWRIPSVIEEHGRWLANHVFDCSVRGNVIVWDVDTALVFCDFSVSTEGKVNKYAVLVQRCFPESPCWSDNGLGACSHPTLQTTVVPVSVFGDGYR